MKCIFYIHLSVHLSKVLIAYNMWHIANTSRMYQTVYSNNNKNNTYKKTFMNVTRLQIIPQMSTRGVRK